MDDLGVLVRLHDLDCDTIGFARVPSPVEIGDLVATNREVFRIVNAVISPPGAPVGALCMVVSAQLHVAAR